MLLILVPSAGTISLTRHDIPTSRSGNGCKKTAFFVTLQQLYTGLLKEELAAKAVAVDELILGPGEAVVLPSDDSRGALTPVNGRCP